MKNKNPKVFLIAGKARHGKDTTAKIIKNYYENKNKKCINLQYSSYIKEYCKLITNWDGSEVNKPRELLQILGAEIIAKNIDELFLVNRIVDDIKVYSYFFDIITISDCRFKTEIYIPKSKIPNTYSIKIIRPNFDNGLTKEQKNHPTETNLDDYLGFDYEFINDGSILELENKINSFLEEVENEK